MSTFTSTADLRVGHSLAIDGIGVWTDGSFDVTGEGWYSTAGFSSAEPWLSWAVDDFEETINFDTAELRVGPISMRITDSAARMTALVRDHRGWVHCRLTDTLSALETSTIVVDDATNLSTAAAVWIDHERIAYTSTGATAIVGLTRGTWGTEAVEHFADPDPPKGLPVTPFVVQGAHSITGRRAIVRAHVADEGTLTQSIAVSEGEVIYRGRVAKGTVVGGGAYQVTLEHLSSILLDKVGSGLPQGQIDQCYRYSGRTESWSLSWVEIIALRTDGSATAPVYDRAVIDAGLYRPYGLASAMSTALSAAVSGVSIFWSGSVAHLQVPSGTYQSLTVNVRQGDPLWALGFDPGSYQAAGGATADHEAQNNPRWCVIDFSERFHGPFASGVAVYLKDTHGFVEGAYVAAKGQRCVRVGSVVSATNQLILYGNTYDPAGAQPPPTAWLIDDESDALIQHVVHVNATMVDAVKQLTHLATSQNEPERWVASGLRSDDIDFAELTSALAGISTHLKSVYLTVLEPTPLWELVGQHLALLGVTPRVTSEGKIGFKRITTPIASDAVSPDLDSAVWSVRGAPRISSRMDDVPVLNQVRVRYGKDYTAEGESWRQPLSFTWGEGNIGGKTRGIRHDCPGLWASGVSTDELEALLLDVLTVGHFGTLGREASSVDIPCTRLSRQYLAGDTVSVTHELLPDTVMGEHGVTNRLAIVTGLRHKNTGSGEDIVTVRFGPAVNSGGIAPAVLITSDDGDDTGTVADNALYSAADLGYYSAGQRVQLVEYDSASPSTAEYDIASVGIGTVTLESGTFSPAGDNFPTPCIMRPATWDSSSHQSYSYIADDASYPTLGATPDDAKEWTL